MIPVLQRQIDAGKINLTGIINTHQYDRLPLSVSPVTSPRELEGTDRDARLVD